MYCTSVAFINVCMCVCLSTVYMGIYMQCNESWMILLDSNNLDKVFLLSFPLKTANVLILELRSVLRLSL